MNMCCFYTKALEGRGVTVAASPSFSRKELQDDVRVTDLIQQIKAVTSV